MNFSYFLGANSAQGFYSLYEHFGRAKGDYLSVIKGGPGTGKSGFMRKIGREAEEKGLDVEYVVCSGDTDSLDGVYIPALHRGWMDGTAPHTADPKSFGVDGDYVNLGAFCKTPLCGEKRQSAERLFKTYRRHYSRAYRFLNAAAAIENASVPGYSDKTVFSVVNALYELAVTKYSGVSSERAQERFLRCIGSKGETVLNDEASKLCREVYSIKNLGLDSAAFEKLSLRLINAGIFPLVCRSPLDGGKFDAVLLPECGVGFVGSAFDVKNARVIEIPQEERGESLKMAELKRTQVDLAVAELKNAKAVHDELEEIFKSETDFNALTDYTQSYINRIFT